MVSQELKFLLNENIINCKHFLRGVRKLYQNRHLHTNNKIRLDGGIKMKLVLIIGAGAVGKMTVGQE